MKLFNRKPKTSKTESRQWFPYISQYFNSGLFPGDENPVVDTVVSRISNVIGMLPVTLFVHTATGDREAFMDPVYQLLKDPSVEESSMLFYKTLVRMLLMKGNCFIFKHRNNRGQILALELVDPKCVLVTRNEYGRKLYTITGERGGIYTDEDILHIPLMSEGYNGTIGKSPIQVHPDVIKRNWIIAEYIAMFFNNGMNSRLLVKLGDEYKIGSPKMEQLVQSFNEYFNKFVLGQQNNGRPIITPPSTDISLLEMSSNVQSDVLKLYNQSCAEICRLFDVPPEIFFSSENKYNSLEQKNADFMISALQPLTTHIGQCLVKGLVDPGYQSVSFVQFNYAVLLETDQNKKLEYYQKAFHGGLMTLAECRTALNLKKYDDDTANNTLIIPANLTPFNKETIDAAMAKSKSIMADMGTGPNSAASEEDKQLKHNPSGDDKE